MDQQAVPEYANLDPQVRAQYLARDLHAAHQEAGRFRDRILDLQRQLDVEKLRATEELNAEKGRATQELNAEKLRATQELNAEKRRLNRDLTEMQGKLDEAVVQLQTLINQQNDVTTRERTVRDRELALGRDMERMRELGDQLTAMTKKKVRLTSTVLEFLYFLISQVYDFRVN